MDPYWRKARIAARILLRSESARLTARDRRLAARLARDPGVTNRLIDQGIACLAHHYVSSKPTLAPQT